HRRALRPARRPGDPAAAPVRSEQLAVRPREPRASRSRARVRARRAAARRVAIVAADTLAGVSAVPYRSTFRRLLGFLKPYRTGLVVSIVLAVGSQAAQIALVGVTGRDVIDRSLLRHDSHRLWISVLAIVGLGLVRAALMAGRRLISGRQALDVEMDMRSGLYAHLVRLSFGFYDRHQTGQLMSRASVDLQGVRFFLGYGLIFFFQNVLTVVSVTGVLFFYEWKLQCGALAVPPLLAALSSPYSHVAHPTLRDVQQKLADVATVAEENI